MRGLLLRLLGFKMVSGVTEARVTMPKWIVKHGFAEQIEKSLENKSGWTWERQGRTLYARYKPLMDKPSPLQRLFDEAERQKKEQKP